MKTNESLSQHNELGRDTPMVNPVSLNLYIIISCLFTAAVVVQMLLAGLAVFVDPTGWGTHISFARMFALLPVVMFLLSWLTRLPKPLMLRSIGLFAMIIGMFATAVLSSRIGFVSALHPVIALLLFWQCTRTIRDAVSLRRKNR